MKILFSKSVIKITVLCFTVLFASCTNDSENPGNGNENNEDDNTVYVLYPPPGAANIYPEGELMISFDAGPAKPALVDGKFIEIYEDGVNTPVDRIRIVTKRAGYNNDTNPDEDKGETQAFTSAGNTAGNTLNMAFTMTWLEDWAAEKAAEQAGTGPKCRNGKDNTLWITPHHGKIQYGKKYHVVIPADALTGAYFGGQPFAGISKGEWSFTTRPAPAGLSAAKPITVNGTQSAGNTANFRTVWGALAWIREAPAGDYTVNIAPGVYNEIFNYNGPAETNITLNGTGTVKYGADVVLQGFNHTHINNGSHIRPAFYFTGPNNVVLKNITFINLDNHIGGQAETLHFGNASGKTREIYNCGFYGDQDTLLTSGRVWFYKCYIEGDTDYIWGSSDVCLFEECELVMILCKTNATRGGAIFAARVNPINGSMTGGVQTGGVIPKGYVILNSTIENKSQGAGNFGRTQSDGTRYDQAALINVVVKGGLWNQALWSVTNTTGILGNSEHAGYKVYNLTTPAGAPYDVSKKDSKTSVMETYLYNKEYNGRRAILNRVYTYDTGRYNYSNTGPAVWDISAYETDFSATPDASLGNSYDPVNVSEIKLTGVTLALNQSKNISHQVLPQDADVKRIIWESGDSDTVSVDQNGRVTGLQGGTVTITASATDGSGVTGTCDVTVDGSLELFTQNWDFKISMSPAGWSTGGANAQPNDAVIEGGMTLMAKTGNENGLANDSGTQHRMGFYDNAVAAGGAGLGFLPGSLRLNGGGTWGKISAGTYSGECKITVCYNSANSSNQRWPALKIGTETYNYDGSLSKSSGGDGGVSGSRAEVLEVTADLTGKDILLKASGGIYIFNIYIEGFK